MNKMGMVLVCFSVIFFGCGTGSNISNSAAEKYTGPYYEGSGGKGIRAAVMRPDGKDLSQNEQWLLDMIQGSITGDFSKYTAITVIDRQNLDKIKANQAEAASGNYSDDDYVSIGNITNAKYIIIGTLTKITANNYLFELGITDATKAERIASYPPQACSYEQLANMSIIKTATEDLLNQLGIVLTASGKAALASVNQAAVNSETALSKGLAAQRQGTVVEAMSYYYNAVSYNPSLKEATSRLSKLSSDISAGNIGENVRNDIERRRQWIAIIEECNAFFKKHLPYEIIYSPVLTQGKVDYENETIDISFPMIAQPNKDDFKIVLDIFTGLDKTGKRMEWDLYEWPESSDAFVDAEIVSADSYDREDATNYNLAAFNITDGFALAKKTDANRNWGQSNWGQGKKIDVQVSLVNSNGKTIAVTLKTFYQTISFVETKGKGLQFEFNRKRPHSESDLIFGALNRPTVFEAVPVSDITDNLTIKINSVDRINVEDINDYVKISTGEVKFN